SDVQPEDGPSLDDPPETVDEGFQRLGEIGTLRALTAEIVDGSCIPIAGHDENEPAPIGSIFKLYVLAALGDAVESGEVSWNDEIVIRDELKSVPSGTLQTREAGEVVTVHEAARLMISISDNTAADHLIDLLGRSTVEATMAAYGHTSPDLNVPFMDTREFTALKVGPASGLRIQWIEGDEEARRSILRQISGITTADLPVQDWTSPIDPHTVEWFARPQDLCRLAAGLLDLSASVPEIAEILATNTGVPAEPGTWESVWFKGGSEPGLAAAWFVTRADARTFVTAGSVVDPEAVIDTDEAVLLLAAIRDLLAP
ncbi:MAG TPA: serine hydrolase, partial [Acidimicrobiia bacterium]